MINAVLADDHEIVRKGIKGLLEDDGLIKVIAEASDGAEAVNKVGELQPDILITDIRMPLVDGLDTTLEVREKYPNVRILVLSMHDDEDFILKSVEYGADGYLLKDTSKPEFLKAIDIIMSGQKYFSGDISSILVKSYLTIKTKGGGEGIKLSGPLTKRESQILSMIYKGVSNKEIASELGKSIRTIETHRFNIMKKLDAKNIADLLRKIESDPVLKSQLVL